MTTDTMKLKDYHKSITVNISAREALDYINRVSEWWATNFKGNSEKLDDIFTVRFGKTFVTFKIIEFLPDKKVVWLVTDCFLDWLKNKKEWKDTKINWEISTNKSAQQISMTHIGLVPGIECYNDCEKGWNFYVGESLLKLITQQKGVPDTPIRQH